MTRTHSRLLASGHSVRQGVRLWCCPGFCLMLVCCLYHALGHMSSMDSDLGQSATDEAVNAGMQISMRKESCEGVRVGGQGHDKDARKATPA